MALKCKKKSDIIFNDYNLRKCLITSFGAVEFTIVKKSLCCLFVVVFSQGECG